jgi:hypothetical protein
MKRILLALSATCLVVGGGIAAAAAVGTPEIDQANATIQVKPISTFVPKVCAGEDGIRYETWRGVWKGGETDLTPGSTDYVLSGPITVGNIVWTVNLKTFRGVLTATAALTAPAGTAVAKTYNGLLTLITQGLPNNPAGAAVPARGWLNAATFTKGVADGGRVLANVEFQITPGFAANGQLGNGSMGLPDWSVATNTQTC